MKNAWGRAHSKEHTKGNNKKNIQKKKRVDEKWFGAFVHKKKTHTFSNAPYKRNYYIHTKFYFLWSLHVFMCLCVCGACVNIIRPFQNEWSCGCANGVWFKFWQLLFLLFTLDIGYTIYYFIC